MIEQLKYDMLILSNKAKFIGAVKHGDIKLRSMTDESLLKALKKGFDADPRAEATDEFAEHGYLIGMNYRSFTNESMQRMQVMANAKQAELDELQETSIQQMWTQDIDAVMSCLETQERTKPGPTKAKPRRSTKKA